MTSTSKVPHSAAGATASGAGPAAAPLWSEPAPQAAAHLGTFAALRQPGFRLFLIGATLSNAAQWIQQVNLGWLVYDLTGSGTALGTVNLVRSAAAGRDGGRSRGS